jgi:hypothetical protein
MIRRSCQFIQIFSLEELNRDYFLPRDLDYFFYGRSAPSGGDDNFFPSAFLLP